MHGWLFNKIFLYSQYYKIKFITIWCHSLVAKEKINTVIPKRSNCQILRASSHTTPFSAPPKCISAHVIWWGKKKCTKNTRHRSSSYIALSPSGVVSRTHTAQEGLHQRLDTVRYPSESDQRVSDTPPWLKRAPTLSLPKFSSTFARKSSSQKIQLILSPN